MAAGAPAAAGGGKEAGSASHLIGMDVGAMKKPDSAVKSRRISVTLGVVTMFKQFEIVFVRKNLFTSKVDYRLILLNVFKKDKPDFVQ